MSRAVLVELYEATNGTGWKEADRANWLTGEPCADAWEGVTCESGNVTELSLYGVGMTGTLPPSLAELGPWLDVLLYGGSDHLSGTLPDFAAFGKLRSLNGCCTSISGTIGTEVGLMTTLENQLSFQAADSSGRYMSGTLPTELGALDKVTQLVLYFQNYISGTVPTELGDLGRAAAQGSTSALAARYTRSLSGTLPTQLGRLTRVEFENTN